MLAARVDKPGHPLQLIDIPAPTPSSGEVLLGIMACGVCHSDLHIIDGDWSTDFFPKIPGHEIAGRVVAVAPDVTDVRIGDRVGVPWIYSTCGSCAACLRGDDPLCVYRKTTGLTAPGGYSQFITVPARSVTTIPDAIPYHAAAPLFCAGLTSYAALKLAAISPGERVAIHGIGGLGHLALQIAKYFGAYVIALTRSEEKRRLCEALGADQTITATVQDAGERLKAAGGADVILSCTPNPSGLGDLIPGLLGNGRMVIVGAGPGDFSVRPKDLIHKRLRIMGSPVGTKSDMKEVLDLAAEGKIQVNTRCYPLAEVNAALSALRLGPIDARLVLIPPEANSQCRCASPTGPGYDRHDNPPTGPASN